MKKLKTQKGITLVALIITIVVLLILAVVAIGAVKDSGIIGHAQNAGDSYAVAQEKEQLGLAVSEAYLAGVGTMTEENLVNGLNSNVGTGKYSIDSSNSEYFKVRITKSGREYKIDKNGKIEGPLESTGGNSGEGGDIVTPPGGEGNPPATYLTQNSEEIEKLATGVSLVEYASLEEGSKLKTLVDNGKVIAVLTDGTYKAVIPSGFTILETSEEGETIEDGLVVVDEQGNEFVWVPVNDTISTTGYTSGTDYSEPSVIGETIYDSYGNITGYTYDAKAGYLHKANCEDMNADGILEISDFQNELINKYEEMAESVNECDGFYVGRYETSKNGEKPQSKASTEENIIRVEENLGDTDWYVLYALNKRYTTNSAQGNMMWGVLYDKMMQWMGPTTDTLIDGYNTTSKCGAAPNDVIKNVYDLYGSCGEFTMETFGSLYRVYRGFINSTYGIRQPSGRCIEFSNSTNGAKGSRLALYIK